MNQDCPTSSVVPLDLSKWRNLPVILMVIGGIGAAAGFFGFGGDHRQFAFSWLVAFMCFLSICVGGLFLVIVHHLFDASWSVATRRTCEHLACLAGWPMLLLFLPILLLDKQLYHWMNELDMPNHSLKAKHPLFTMTGFYVVVAFCFGVWWFWSNRLRYWSLQQDKTGAAFCTKQMRFYACTGVVVFALSVTIAAIMWMKALMYEWFSTMYGVCYFASSVWLTLATVYVITMLLQRTTRLREVARERTYYMLGSLLFAFTVFWAYVNFAQYFIIWNANMPEETFWFVKREAGTWFFTGAIIIIFGHFFVPFLGLLRIDVKLKLVTMLPLCAWAWLMHFIEMEFQIMPELHPDGVYSFHFPFVSGGLFLDIACFLFIGGVLSKVFLWSLSQHPVYPLKDPRMAEALEMYVTPASAVSVAPTNPK